MSNNTLTLTKFLVTFGIIGTLTGTLFGRGIDSLLKSFSENQECTN